MRKSDLFTVIGVALLIELAVGGYFAWERIEGAYLKAQEAQETAQKTAQTVAEFSKSPFTKTTLDTISVNGGAALPPTQHALYVHPCDWIALRRTATVLEDMAVSVGRSIQGPVYSLPLLAGSERFYVKKNPNLMRPLFQVPSNVPRYEYLTYDVFLQDVSRPSPAEQLQAIHFYVIDSNQPIPKPGDPIPAGPGLNDPPGPLCPASSIAPPSPAP